MNFCNCYKPLPVKTALRYLKEETIEFIQKPSMDELGDVVRVINRLAGALCKRTEIKILPYPKVHLDKVNKRMSENGCIRSSTHLVDGKCPSSISIK